VCADRYLLQKNYQNILNNKTKVFNVCNVNPILAKFFSLPTNWQKDFMNLKEDFISLSNEALIIITFL
jgi:hypothetical protein